jgi:hypothetical protein
MRESSGFKMLQRIIKPSICSTTDGHRKRFRRGNNVNILRWY